MSETPSPVKAARTRAGLRQADLATAVGVSRQTVVSLERGDYAPSVYLAIRIARTLNSSVEELFPLPEEH
ncbi:MULTISPECIES: helix-turn-helix transcriptional regulator [Gordonia]|uniref:helix-turn-helix transcriptional regulator n=1 Tax=Gordonia TaxID=2053 RepID=UPI0005875083|nr:MULTISPECIES: helix-turn-helix transcriptional regulator [Gordonia]AUH69981.1 transcriptional regulator [Gordonia sp. YC-JH1]KXT57186.1 XRE family transcriptional regulator [Gordonia sp. QH-12]MBY4570049.1 transcriptional regulator [Gordonia sihwensis]WFN93338.1 helix-turn-helix transcriptional regulator [Gordonia sihwensis]